MASQPPLRDSIRKKDLLPGLDRELKKAVAFPQRTLRSFLRLNPHPTSVLGAENGVRRLGVGAPSYAP